tara:strand:+ start:378 stop:860 length:483 start_codon:yes stop_codon:yes gene_type:complete
MAGIYNIDTTGFNPRILDRASVFPPKSRYYVTIEPNVGEIIQASQCVAAGLSVSFEGDTNSLTKSPSRFQYYDTSSLSPAFYKVVFQDSMNPSNNPNFIADDSNVVYMWIYFGLDENTPTNNLNMERFSINVIVNKTAITRTEITNPINIVDNKITNFNF